MEEVREHHGIDANEGSSGMTPMPVDSKEVSTRENPHFHLQVLQKEKQRLLKFLWYLPGVLLLYFQGG